MYKRRGDKQNVSFVSFLVRAKRRRGEEGRKEEEEEEEEGEGEEDQTKVCFILKSWVFWIPKVLVWILVPSFLGFCGRDHPNPRFLLRLCA